MPGATFGLINKLQTPLLFSFFFISSFGNSPGEGQGEFWNLNEAARAGLGGKAVRVLNAKGRCSRSVQDAGVEGGTGFSFLDTVLAILVKFTLFLLIAA